MGLDDHCLLKKEWRLCQIDLHWSWINLDEIQNQVSYYGKDRCWNWLLNMSKSQIRSKTELVKPMKRLQLSGTAHSWTWRWCHCLPSLCSLSCWQGLFYSSVCSMLLEESHGHLGSCLCEGICAGGAKSESCWVSSVFHSISQPEALAEPEGTKSYVWHFPSSLPFALSNLAAITQTGQSVQTFTHTLVQQSLPWDVYSPSTFSFYSRIAFFC